MIGFLETGGVNIILMSRTLERENCKEHEIKTISKTIADMPSGSLMLIPSTKIVDKFVRNITKDTFVNFKSLRIKLANKFKCDVTCPLTFGIFMRIVSEAAYEEHISSLDLELITAFQRAVDSNSNLAKKLECGVDFIIEQQEKEEIKLKYPPSLILPS